LFFWWFFGLVLLGLAFRFSERGNHRQNQPRVETKPPGVLKQNPRAAKARAPVHEHIGQVGALKVGAERDGLHKVGACVLLLCVVCGVPDAVSFWFWFGGSWWLWISSAATTPNSKPLNKTLSKVPTLQLGAGKVGVAAVGARKVGAAQVLAVEVLAGDVGLAKLHGRPAAKLAALWGVSK
jgi:hypothetical protein